VTASAPRLRSLPLAVWERDGLAAALAGAGLRFDDVAEPDRLFWRFEREDDTPAGFGGLEIHGGDALLRSVVILPPLRRAGVGGAIVTALEREAEMRGAKAVYLLAPATETFFAGLGYRGCAAADVPASIRASGEFLAAAAASAPVLFKRL
jgi:N-acetylglutamate synthase-like GNAT family acetyltransferase